MNDSLKGSDRKMKRVCRMLALVSLLALALIHIPALAEEAEATCDEQIIVLVRSVDKRAAATRDVNGLLPETIRGFLHLAPKSARLVVLESGEVAASTERQSLAEVADALRVNIATTEADDNANLAKALDMLPDAEHTTVIVIDCSYNYLSKGGRAEKSLTALAEGGASVYYVLYETQNNASNSRIINGLDRVFSSALSKEDKAAKDVMFELAEGMSYIRISDFASAAVNLLPMAEAVSGETFAPVEKQTGSTALLHVALAERTIFLLPGDFRQSVLLVTDQAGAEATVDVWQSAALTVLTVDGGYESLHVSVDGKPLDDGYWASALMDGVPFSFALRKASGSDVFRRNDQGTFTLVMEGGDPAALDADMKAHGAVWKLAADGSETVDMVFENGYWTASYTFDHSNPELVLRAELAFEEGITFTAAETVVITNEAPTVALADDGEVFHWINNPWNAAANNSLTIPLNVIDTDNDQVTLSFPNGPSVPGLGNVSVGEDGKSIEIRLNSTPDTDATHEILVVADDGEAKSEQLTVVVRLVGAREELSKLRAEHVLVRPEADLHKGDTITVSFELTAEGSSAPEQLLALATAQYGFTVTCEGNATPMTLQADGKTYTAGMELKKSGKHDLTIVCDAGAGTDAPLVEVTALETEVVNRRPQMALDALPIPGDAMLEGPKDQERYEFTLVASELFTDEDSDDVTLSVQLARIEADGETPLALVSENGQWLVADKGGQTDTDQHEKITLKLTDEGSYVIRVVGYDGEDISEITYHATLNMTSSYRVRVQMILLIVAAIVPAAVLVLIVIQLLKPSFKGKTIVIAVSTRRWSQETAVALSAWKKRGQPLAWLLTAAACPTDQEIYSKVENVVVKPSGKGVKLADMRQLTGRRTEQLLPGQTLKIIIGAYDILLTIPGKV